MNILNSKIILYKKEPIYLFRLSVVMTIIVLSIFVSLFYLKYSDYYKNKAVLIYDENYYLKILVLLDDMDTIIDNKWLIIDNVKYEYKVFLINNELLVDNNFNNYKEILISVKLPKKKLIKNNIVDFKIEKSSKKLINYLQKYL